MFCQNCGKQLADNVNACPYCGAALENAMPTGQQPAQQAAPMEQQAAQQPAQQAAPMGQQPVQQPMQQPVQQAVPMGQQPAYNPQGVPNAYAQAYPIQTPPAKKKSKAGIIIGIAVAVFAIIAVIAVVIISGSKPEKNFYGEWLVTIDYTQKCKENIGEFKDYLGDDFQVRFDVNVVFNDDGTYSIQEDANSVKALKEDIRKPIEKAFLAACRDENSKLASLTDEQIKKAYEIGSGESFDDYLDKLVNSFDLDSITKKNFEGQYKVDKEHFYLSAAKDKLVDETEYAVYELKNDNTIEIKDYIIDGKSNDVIFSLPCTLQKIK
ncbi:MAG: zinc ribbon domain-containing protein [Clostridia bacterium]|nr:zinc ribbon domain-containing protein [Clostridia bacterium]